MLSAFRIARSVSRLASALVMAPGRIRIIAHDASLWSEAGTSPPKANMPLAYMSSVCEPERWR
jgi:hypothetical protein